VKSAGFRVGKPCRGVKNVRLWGGVFCGEDAWIVSYHLFRTEVLETTEQGEIRRLGGQAKGQKRKKDRSSRERKKRTKSIPSARGFI